MVQKRLPMLPASSLCRWRTESGVAKEITRPCRQGKRDMGGWWLVVGGWWLVVGGWWLVAGGELESSPATSHQPPATRYDADGPGSPGRGTWPAASVR